MLSEHMVRLSASRLLLWSKSLLLLNVRVGLEEGGLILPGSSEKTSQEKVPCKGIMSVLSWWMGVGSWTHLAEETCPEGLVWLFTPCRNDYGQARNEGVCVSGHLAGVVFVHYVGLKD